MWWTDMGDLYTETLVLAEISQGRSTVLVGRRSQVVFE